MEYERQKLDQINGLGNTSRMNPNRLLVHTHNGRFRSYLSIIGVPAWIHSHIHEDNRAAGIY